MVVKDVHIQYIFTKPFSRCLESSLNRLTKKATVRLSNPKLHDGHHLLCERIMILLVLKKNILMESVWDVKSSETEVLNILIVFYAILTSCYK